MKVLIFDRPFTKKFFSYYSEIEGFKITRISDFKNNSEIDIVKKQYDELPKNRKSLNQITLDDVIKRDRYLRNINRDLAEKLCNALWSVYTRINIEEYDLVLGPPIDNYYLDLLERFCAMQGVKSEFLIQSFLPGLTRITKRGEYRFVREVNDEMVERYLKILLNENFKPTTLKPHWSKIGLLKIYLKERAKKIVFEFLKVIKRDPYSFHYNCIYRSGFNDLLQNPRIC